MSSITPPTSNERSATQSGDPPKRPRYLVIALIGALLTAAMCWSEGYNSLAFFRGGDPRGVHPNEVIHDDLDRSQAEALYQKFIDATDASRGIAVPLAAAIFVLGVALFMLASRALAARSNTRSAVMQVVAAQALVVVARYFALTDVRVAEANWAYQSVIYYQHEHLDAQDYARFVKPLPVLRRWGPPAWLLFRTLASGLIVVALSRRRSRDFFEAAARPVSER